MLAILDGLRGLILHLGQFSQTNAFTYAICEIIVRADTNNTIDLLKTIASRGITMVVIDHDMHVVFSLANKNNVLAQGHLVAEGAPNDTKGGLRVQETYLEGAKI